MRELVETNRTLGTLTNLLTRNFTTTPPSRPTTNPPSRNCPQFKSNENYTLLKTYLGIIGVDVKFHGTTMILSYQAMSVKIPGTYNNILLARRITQWEDSSPTKFLTLLQNSLAHFTPGETTPDF